MFIFLSLQAIKIYCVYFTAKSLTDKNKFHQITYFKICILKQTHRETDTTENMTHPHIFKSLFMCEGQSPRLSLCKGTHIGPLFLIVT